MDCPYLSGCSVLHLQFEWSVKTLDVSERREIHLVLVKLELQTTERHRGNQPAGTYSQTAVLKRRSKSK